MTASISGWKWAGLAGAAALVVVLVTTIMASADTGGPHKKLFDSRWYQQVAGDDYGSWMTLTTSQLWFDCDATAVACRSKWSVPGEAALDDWNSQPMTVRFNMMPDQSETYDVNVVIDDVILDSPDLLGLAAFFDQNYDFCPGDCTIWYGWVLIADDGHSGPYGTEAERQGTIAHELGHLLSLRHESVNADESVLYPCGQDNTGVIPHSVMSYNCIDPVSLGGAGEYWVQPWDVCGVNHAYFDPNVGFAECAGATPPATPTPTPATPTPTPPAGAIAGDVNCDLNVTSIDALLILRHVAALSVNLPGDCPDIGAPASPSAGPLLSSGGESPAGGRYGALRYAGRVTLASLPEAPDSQEALPPVEAPRRPAPERGGAPFQRGAAGPAASAVDRGASAALSPPVVEGDFAGLDSADNARLTAPPDPQLAAGLDHVIEMVNTSGRVFDKGGTVLHTFALANLFQVPDGWKNFDPKVIYDAPSGRFFATYVSYIDSPAGEDTGYLHIAVSTTGDPLGSWDVYYLEFSDIFPDYPGLGVTNDKVTVSYNLFDIDGPPGPVSPGCTAGGFCAEQTVVIEKAEMLASAPSVGLFEFPLRPDRFTVRPAHSLTSTGDQYLATFDQASYVKLTLIRVTGTPEAGNVTEASAVDLPIQYHDSPPPAEMAGIGAVDAGDYRLLEAVWRDGRLWTSASAACTPVGDSLERSCLHLIEVNTATNSVTQDMLFGQAGAYYFYPAVRTDSAGNLHAVFSASTPSSFIEARVAGRLVTDPPNTMSGSTVLKAGEMAYSPAGFGAPPFRWGDYMGAALDPADPSVVWVVGQYAKDDGAVGWGTWIGGLRYGAGGPTPTIAPTPTPSPGPKVGDVNCDGDVTSVDALFILRYVAFLPVTLPPQCPTIGSPN